MELSSLSHAWKAYALALLSRAAYRDNCYKTFSYWEIAEDYRFIDRSDVQAHLGSNDRTVVVIFRGTSITEVRDILTDLKIWPKTNGVGWVHTGFREYARKLMPKIFDYVKRHPGKKIIIAGHSKGGAMGLYIAQELHWAGYTDIELYTYGAPRLGNRRYVKNIPIEHHRFVNCNDIVPRLPWMFLGYRHHGIMHYISADGKICRPLAWQRFRDAIVSRLQSWSRLRPINVVADHNMLRYIEKLKKIKSQS